MRTIRAFTLGALLLAVPAAAPAQPPLADEDFTQSFRFRDCRFESRGTNPYFPLQPGRRLVYEGVDEEGAELKLLVTVLRETRRITLDLGGRQRTVLARVVEEREFEDGDLVEVSRNFFAVCARTDDVVYFGEDVDIYQEDGSIVHDGAWLAGQAGASPGLIMPGTFLLGSRYFQERAPGIAMDRAEHTRMGLAVDTPHGLLTDCVEVRETSPLEPGAESIKLYCPGIGLAVDGPLRLTEVIRQAEGGDDGADGD
jgi:hypothetical protein